MQALMDSLVLEAQTKVSLPIHSVLDPKFPKQCEFVRDPARKKALWCTRRAAKSYSGGTLMIQTALDYPQCNVLYIGIARMVAKGIMWKDILTEINTKHQIDYTPNLTELTMTYANGSMIYLTGVDANEEEMKKLLGKKWKLVVIDEAQSYRIDLHTLVYGVLGPTVIDQGGTICLLGTAGNKTTGLFFDVTTNKEAGWKLFSWSALDNPYVAVQWQAELDEIQRTRPAFMETALFKQWYLNQWVVDEEAKVYKFNEFRNVVVTRPADFVNWRYVLGVDLAHSPDSTAFVIGAYVEGYPILFIIYAHKALKMDITDVALHIHLLENKYKFDVKVCDGANKQAVAELNNRHKLNLIPADKKDKSDFIKIMNDDFIQGKIVLLKNETKSLQTEYSTLCWITDPNGKVIEPRKEDESIHNDLSDSCLYLWRYCYTYLDVFANEKKWINPHDQKQWEPAHIEKLQQQIKKDQNPNHLELEWNDSWDEQEREFNEVFGVQ